MSDDWRHQAEPSARSRTLPGMHADPGPEDMPAGPVPTSAVLPRQTSALSARGTYLDHLYCQAPSTLAEGATPDSAGRRGPERRAVDFPSRYVMSVSDVSSWAALRRRSMTAGPPGRHARQSPGSGAPKHWPRPVSCRSSDRAPALSHNSVMGLPRRRSSFSSSVLTACTPAALVRHSGAA